MSHNHDERCFRDPHGCYLEAATRKDDPMTFVDRMTEALTQADVVNPYGWTPREAAERVVAQLGQNRSENATLLPEDAEFSDLALLDQPLLTVEEDGDHEHTGVPCRTCVALGLPEVRELADMARNIDGVPGGSAMSESVSNLALLVVFVLLILTVAVFVTGAGMAVVA